MRDLQIFAVSFISQITKEIKFFTPSSDEKLVNNILANFILPNDMGHAVAYLVEALCYKPEDHSFGSR
jgi:hypothetical protein